VLPSGADLTIVHESEVFGPSLPPVAGDTGTCELSIVCNLILNAGLGLFLFLELKPGSASHFICNNRSQY
jgi:hypothetical protein